MVLTFQRVSTTPTLNATEQVHDFFFVVDMVCTERVVTCKRVATHSKQYYLVIKYWVLSSLTRR